MSADPKTPLDEARAALAEYDAPACDRWLGGCFGLSGGGEIRCTRRQGHDGDCDGDADTSIDPEILRTALAEVDRLTTENARLREALTAERAEARRQLAEERARVAHLTPAEVPPCPECGDSDQEDGRRNRVTGLCDMCRREAEASVDTGDCRTCKFSSEDDDGSWCHHPDRQAAGAWKNGKPPTAAWSYVHLSSDNVTRLPTSPPCPGHTRKES